MEKLIISTQENFKSEILIQEDIRNDIQNFFENKKYFLITNTKLAKLYPEFIYKFHDNRVIIIKDGEKYKNLETFEYILNQLLKEKIERKDCIVALGGGVVGDLAGYAASSILRGVELIQIPTTLLAMCDSSIGGKTGFNTKYGKNLIGSFYMANKILIDPIFLNTLNEREYKCGLGEVLKYAFIEKSCNKYSNFDLIDFLEKNQSQDIKSRIIEVIKMCASLKASVVANDRLEGGLRKVLNFGHTYAHAIETLSKYKKFSHGEAVAFGIKYASKLALIKGMISHDYYDKINFLLDKFELTKKEIKFKREDIVELMKQDKKVLDNKINLLLPTGPAQVALFDNIDLPSIEASLL
ncbi:MAG: 3-dehydroquinate synthase [Candidatus Gastranaerophilales bacterium]|nr:3-dehydroquinate synthase [Candidatus Gastranaerophilales bacterium]